MRSQPAALSGLTVVVPRGPERAGELIDELAARGARALLVPVIDFELPSSTDDLDDSLRTLAKGQFAWLVVTSVNTVWALRQRALAMGATLAELVGATEVAAVGEGTRGALEAQRIAIQLTPETHQSAAGLVELWPTAEVSQASTTSVLLPQSDLAAMTLRDGLADRGWRVQVVVAYRTVDHPADEFRRLAVPPTVIPGSATAADAWLESNDVDRGVTTPVLGIDELRRMVAAGEAGAVVLTSPSITRRLEAALGELLAGLLLVAIGQRTAQQATTIGLPVAAVASRPTPKGIVDALARAVATPIATLSTDHDAGLPMPPRQQGATMNPRPPA